MQHSFNRVTREVQLLPLSNAVRHLAIRGLYCLIVYSQTYSIQRHQILRADSLLLTKGMLLFRNEVKMRRGDQGRPEFDLITKFGLITKDEGTMCQRISSGTWWHSIQQVNSGSDISLDMNAYQQHFD